MSEEEFFNIAINRICKDYDYNFANEFKLLFLKKDKEIERLQRQKEELQVNGLRQETLFKLEIERLNNIIEEIIKICEENEYLTLIKDIKRLKGSDKE